MANPDGLHTSELPLDDFGLDEFGFPRQYAPDVPIGAIWVDHGYQTSPTFTDAEDCPVCGAPMTTCTNETHRAGMIAQGANEGSV
ncbi:hypothetical protein SEA_DALANDE_29 [Gordonia phage DalanDe]|nr:hypothetical protein SEA_DALANDE_29 [Gordonia phage DalanDe]